MKTTFIDDINLNEGIRGILKDRGTDPAVFKEALDRAVKSREKEELMKVCREFESIFINMLMKQMRATIPKSDFLNRGIDREIFESMFDEEVSKEMAKGGGIGLAREIYRSLVAQIDRKV